MEYELHHPPVFPFWVPFPKKRRNHFFVLGFPRKLLLCWSPWPLNLPHLVMYRGVEPFPFRNFYRFSVARAAKNGGIRNADQTIATFPTAEYSHPKISQKGDEKLMERAPHQKIQNPQNIQGLPRSTHSNNVVVFLMCGKQRLEVGQDIFEIDII